MAVLDEGEALMMKLKKDPDSITIQAVLWVLAVVFGALAWIEKEPWAFWSFSAPCVVVSLVYALYRRGRVIVVGEDGIESVSFFVLRRFVPWECVVSYREKEKKGGYMSHTSWTAYLSDRSAGMAWVEGSLRLKVTLASGLPLRVSNSYAEYKKFKKVLREKGILRVKKIERKKKVS